MNIKTTYNPYFLFYFFLFLNLFNVNNLAAQVSKSYFMLADDSRKHVVYPQQVAESHPFSGNYVLTSFYDSGSRASNGEITVDATGNISGFLIENNVRTDVTGIFSINGKIYAAYIFQNQVIGFGIGTYNLSQNQVSGEFENAFGGRGSWTAFPVNLISDSGQSVEIHETKGTYSSTISGIDSGTGKITVDEFGVINGTINTMNTGSVDVFGAISLDNQIIVVYESDLGLLGLGMGSFNEIGAGGEWQSFNGATGTWEINQDETQIIEWLIH